MGRLHLWRVLLLASLLFGSIRAADLCTALPPTKCPDRATPAFHDCSKLVPPVLPSMKCSAQPGTELFVDMDGSGTTWSKGFKSVDCAAGKWTAIGNVAADNFVVDIAKTKIVCAKDGSAAPPPLPDCQKCVDAEIIDAAYCDASNGCTIGEGQQLTVEGGCNVLKCKDSSQYFTSPEAPGRIDEITCNKNQEWENLGLKIMKAVCIKGYSCMSKSGNIKSDCSDLKYNFKDCDPVTANDDDNDVTCTAGKYMYYRPDASEDWQEHSLHNTYLKCDKSTGNWQAGGENDLATDDHVVCASEKPTLKKDCLDPLNSGCRSDVHAKAVCTPVAIDTAKDVSCTNGSPYLKSAGEYEKVQQSITCNREHGTWQKGGSPFTMATSDNIICSDSDPNIRNCQTPTFEMNCPPKASTASKCTDLPAPSETSDAVVKCTDPNNLYTSTDGVKFTLAIDLHCDTRNGDWKHRSSKVAVLDSEWFVCAVSEPDPLSCMEENPIVSSCVGVDAAGVVCKEVAAKDDAGGLQCPTSSMQLYYFDDGSWKPTAAMKCDKKTGNWVDDTDQAIASTEVICADKQPANPPKCTAPPSDCSSIATTPIDPDCLVPSNLETMPRCDNRQRLYVKVASGDKFMRAVSIVCRADGQFEMEIKYEGEDGKTRARDSNTKHDTFANLICADFNPEPNICGFISYNEFSMPVNLNEFESRQQQSMNDKKFDAGTIGTCGKGFVIISDKDSEVPVEDPVCFPDGKWKSADEENRIVYDKLACAVRRCKLCSDLPVITTKPTDPNPQFEDFDMPFGDPPKRYDIGVCDHYECEPPTQPITIITTGGEEYFQQKLTCSSGAKWTFGEGKDAAYAKCMQRWPCLNNWKDGAKTSKFPQVSLDCPTGAKEVPGCQSPQRSKGSSPNFPDEKLACPPYMIMLLQPKSVNWWHTLIDKDTTCDATTGTWKTRRYNIYDEHKEASQREIIAYSFDHDNTIICAPSNPNPEPMTTTTTTTTEAPKEICDLCKGNLPNITCDTCDNEIVTTLERGTKEGVEVCILYLNKTDYILTVDQTQQPKLVCKRSDGKWQTEGEQPVSAIKAIKEPKKGEWKPISYVILAVAILMIGGMAIGCVLIYTRMRKKLSEREIKKKERGVTKKYTASNVMRAGGRSSGGSKEAGKSREPTSSKMEENIEDAPTLKL